MKLIAKTFQGLEQVLAKEIKNLGGEKIKILNRAVEFQGNKEILYKANYNLRTAIKILYPIKEFKIKNSQDLYNEAIKIKWENIFDLSKTFAIQATIYSHLFSHSNYPALKLKDAIADRFRQKFGKRPNVNKYLPDVKVDLFIKGHQVVISLDSSGEALFKRKYRKQTVSAPLNEALAAGLVLLSGWDKKTDFIDFMCGSGTIPIEAYLIATNTPPQILRKNFSFQNWLDYDDRLWKKIVISSKKLIKNKEEVNIFAFDKSQKAIEIAKNNFSQISKKQKINFRVVAFENLEKQVEKFAIINPPYSVRMAVKAEKFYKNLMEQLPRKFQNSEIWVFTGYNQLKFNINLDIKKEFVLFNGGIQTKFFQIKIH